METEAAHYDLVGESPEEESEAQSDSAQARINRHRRSRTIDTYGARVR
jgi:hypothetical protein